MTSAATQQFVSGLKSRHADVRLKTAEELSLYLKSELREATQEEINAFLDEFNHHIFEMVSANDLNEKKGGILAILCLIGTDVGNIPNRVTRFANYLRNLLPSSDVSLLQMVTKSMGMIALVSGSKASEYVDFEVKRAFEWLGGDRVESKRHAAVLILRELALTMPTYFYQQVSGFFEAIFNAIQDPKPQIREAGVEALRAALVVTAQRESGKQRLQWYKQCYDETQKLLSTEKVDKFRDDKIHGALLVLNELVRVSNAKWESKYKSLVEVVDKTDTDEIFINFGRPNFKPYQKSIHYRKIPSTTQFITVESPICRQLVTDTYSYICLDVLGMRLSRLSYTQQSLLVILPRLAAFNREYFVKEHLANTMNYLLNTIRGREKDRTTSFIAIGLIGVAVEDDIKPFIPKIMEVITVSLPNREAPMKKRLTMDASVFKCITFLAHAVKSYITKDIQNLLEQMFATGLTSSLTSCLKDLARDVPDLKSQISIGLLSMLYKILMSKPLRHPGMPRHLPQTASLDVPDTSSIVLALHTLGTFDFEGHSLLQLVQKCADDFIVHENHEIRLEAVKTCSRLLKQNIYNPSEEYSDTVMTTVADVLNKLLVVGITDTDSEVRRGVLYSLDTTFDEHLAQVEFLSMLFVALHDEVFEIREVALMTIGRLSTKNPSYIMPALRKTIVQLLTELEHSGTGRNKEQGARMLDHLVVNAPRLMRPYIQPILKVLVPKLKESEPNPGVVLSVLVTIGDLASVTGGGIELQEWTSDLMTILLEMLGDSSAPEKRGATLCTLGQLVGATGHVIQPYTEYPALLDVLINFLKTEQHAFIRRETIRVLGLLGALDPYRHKINRGQIDYQSEAPVLIALADKNDDTNADLTTSEMLVNMSSSTLEEYYLAMSIATLMRIIKDPTLSQHHTTVVQAVIFIFKSLGIKCVPYISQVLPSLLNVVRTADVNFREYLFQQLAQLILIVKQHIRNYLDDICALIKEFWTPNSTIQGTLIVLIEHIAIALGSEFSVYLPKLMPQILRVLNHDTSKDRVVTLKMLEALKKFGNNVDDYMHLIIPQIVKLFDAPDCPTAVSKQALETIDHLADNLDFSDFISRIIHPLIRTFDQNPELRSVAIETLVSLVTQLGRKFTIFIPLVHKVMAKHKIHCPRYDMLIAQLQSDSTLADDSDFKVPIRRAKKHRDSGLPSDTAMIQRLKVNANNLRLAWTINRRVSRDDWLEWLRTLSIELLKQSPIPALRSCQSLAQTYSQLPKDLFNASFVSCWTELSEAMQKELINNLRDALLVPDIPEITQTILNLAEFMEHCDKGPLPLEPQLLGERAMDCRAYAKALHYKEEEFQRGANSQVVEALISINNKLQQKEAAEGLLQFVMQKGGDMPIEVRWYEKLHNWDKARLLYEEKMSKGYDEEALLGQMRCLEALGEWEDLHNIAEAKFDELSGGNQEKAGRLAAASAWGIHHWTSMEKYVTVIPRETQDGAFYRAILAIHEKQYDEAQKFIDSARDLLDNELTAMASESYQRAYGAMIMVQMLAELEEVIQYKLVPERRETIRTMWWQRLQAGQRIVEDWQRIIQIHSLVLTPHEDMHTWLKYASLCRKNGSLMLSHKTLVMLLNYNPEDHPDIALPYNLPEVTFAYTKHLWMAEKKKEAYHRLDEFLTVYSKQYSFGENTNMDESKRLLARCYLKLGSWMQSIQGIQEQSIPVILERYHKATEHDPYWYKAWHSWAYMNYETVLFYKQEHESSRSNLKQDRTINLIKYTVNAVTGFFKSINLSKGSSLQDTLRLLTLWFEYGNYPDVYQAISDGLFEIEKNTWLQVIPQLIARIDSPRALVTRLIHQLLIVIGKSHPQALIYPLTVATKSQSITRKKAADKILDAMADLWPKLVNQAKMVSDELIRVAILWHEMWHEGLEEASRLFFGEDDVEGMLKILDPLHNKLARGAQTLKEKSFCQAYGRDLNEAQEWCEQYKKTKDRGYLSNAWDLYYHVFRKITRQLPQLTSLELQYVSLNLLFCKDLELAIPGSYCPGQEPVTIAFIHPSLEVITSKQRPRKLLIRGSNGKDYMFLLKGHEDLRQDERVMQIFGLVNTLLLKDPDTVRCNLTIQRYAVIPLSTNSGLIGWVPHCDTLHTLIKDYREKKKILLNIEHRIMLRMAPDYDHLTVIQKVEAFEQALEHTHGDDLARLLWLKSPSSEVWFDRRTNCTRSLAVMSMVGYILGLGDRHPSNLMLDRLSGKILHIDFGDCFEVAMTREKFSEKIPFRLTRMLINAMEVTGIEGTYRRTCESVMSVLRRNKDSVMAVLEAFVYDPLLNWRLVDTGRLNRSNTNDVGSISTGFSQEQDLVNSLSVNMNKIGLSSPEAMVDGSEPEVVKNKKAVAIVNRVKDKLTGNDFSIDETLTIEMQVDRLIQQATDNENLCQCYIGGCPFW
nr:target of rapamycin [Onthophagus taurus]